MKVSELKDMLQYAKDDDNVVIALSLPYATVGGRPFVNVNSVYSGFDWDNGKFFLTPEFPLTTQDMVAAELTKELQEKLGWCEYEKRGLKSQIAKLKKENK